MATNTTVTNQTHNGNGSTATFAISFPFLENTEIDVSVGGVLKTLGTHYNINGSSITFTSGNIPPSGTGNIRFQRDTNISAKKVDFADGSVLTETDLDNNSDQILFAQQEFIDDYVKRDGSRTITGSLIFEGGSEDDNETTLAITDPTADRTITIPDVTGTVVTTGDTGTVSRTMIAGDAINGTKIANDSINSEHYVNLSIDTEHIANEQVTTAKIANLNVTSSKIADLNVTRGKLEADAVDGTKLADNAVDSEHYTDGSIDHVHLSNDAVDGDNIADNSINSEHYVDGSIDHVHLANDIIDGDNIQDNVINSEHYVDGSIDHVHLANDIIDGDNIQDSVINSEHYVDGSIDREHLAADIVDGTKIADDSVDSEHIAAGALDNEHYAAGSITSDKLNGATVVTNSEQSGYSVNDTSFFTTAAAEARYFNISTGETIKDGDTFPDNDTTIATTAAINDRIIDLVDDVGGFVPIASETDFPTANPDVNNGSGTLVSIKAIGSTRTPSSGTVTISNGSGSNTVTITGCGTTVLTAGFGVIVETTSTLHTYAFHRLVPKATEVTIVAANATNIAAAGANTTNINTVAGNNSNINTVAGISSNVTTVAGISSNVTTVAGISSDVTAVAADASDIGAVAAKATEIGRLGTADAVADMNTLGTSAIVSDMDTLADISSNITTVAGISGNVTTVAGISSNVTTVANANSNITTVAGANSNISTVAGAIANVNTTASNIADVNNFAATYQIASSAPSTDGAGNALAAGDLYFDTTANELRVHNGSTFQGGVTATGNLAGLGANTFTGNQSYGDNIKNIFGAGSDLEIFHNANDSIINDAGQGSLKLQSGGSTKIEVTSTGTSITGNVVVTGNVDGRDVSADGTKLDGIEASATADQTAAEIRTLVESASDSNVFTDADHTKLNGIETAATADQTAAEIRTLVESASDSNVFTDADHSKLNGIEASATADQTASEIVSLLSDQNISTTGTLGVGNTTISSTSPFLTLNDTNSENDFSVQNADGTFRVRDVDAAVNRLTINSSGTAAFSGNLDVGAGLDVTGSIQGTSSVVAGLGGGGVALTINDGYGNANVCFNHKSGTPEQNGNAGRILVNTDSTSSANMQFQVKSNVTSGSAGGLTSVLALYETNVVPPTDSAIDLGSSSKRWANGYFDALNVAGDVTITDDLFLQDNLYMGDTDAFIMGDSEDLIIKHDGTHNFIQTGGPDIIIYGTGEDLAKFIDDGAVELYYDGTKRFETTSTGVAATGDLDLLDSGFVELRIKSTNNDAVIQLTSNNDDDKDWTIRNDYSNSFDLDFRYNNSRKMDLDASGNLTVVGNVATPTIKSASAAAPVFQNSSGTEIGTLCKAWVNFAAGNASIRDDFNVSSVTDNGNGNYTVNFAAAFSDDDYAFALGAGRGTNNGAICVQQEGSDGMTTTQFQMKTRNLSNNQEDFTHVSAAFFR